MSETRLPDKTGLADCTPEDWIDQLEEIAEEAGFFEPLGPDHQASFVAGRDKLLVTFEDAETILRMPGAEPRGFAFARREGWAHLAIVARAESWFRHRAIYGFFDRMTDEGFFEEFDSVLFHGAGGAGYAACAYSVAAPGARVLAFRPQATLEPDRAGWDPRFKTERRRDFSDRYGFAPDMVDAADKAWIVFDPAQRFDAIHGAFFVKSNVTMLRSTGLGPRPEAMLDSLGLHDDLIRAAMAGDLDAARFARITAARKADVRYQRSLLKRAEAAGHPQLAANVAAYILARRDDAVAEAKLADLADQGITPARPPAASAAE